MRMGFLILSAALFAACGQNDKTAKVKLSPLDLFSSEETKAPDWYAVPPLAANVRFARVNPDVFKRLNSTGMGIRLNLVTDPVATAALTDRQSQVDGARSCRGHLQGETNAMVHLSHKNKHISGTIALPGKPQIIIRHVTNDLHVILEIPQINPGNPKGD